MTEKINMPWEERQLNLLVPWSKEPVSCVLCPRAGSSRAFLPPHPFL